MMVKNNNYGMDNLSLNSIIPSYKKKKKKKNLKSNEESYCLIEFLPCL